MLVDKERRKFSKSTILFINLYIFLSLTNVLVAEDTLCETTQCLAYANTLLQSLNTTGSACDDFYNYVCGKWPENHPAKDRYYISAFDEWWYKGDERIIDILKRIPAPTDAEASKKARRIYEMCISDIGESGLDYLKRFLDELGGWPITIYPRDAWNPNGNIKWQDIHKNFTRYFLRGAFYTIDTARYPGNDQHIVIVAPKIEIVDFNASLMRNVSRLMIPPKLLSQDFRAMGTRDVFNVVNLVFKLKRIQTTDDDSDEGIRAYSLRELNELYLGGRNASTGDEKSKIEWLDIFQDVYSSYNLNESQIVYVANKTYFENLYDVLEQTPLRTIVNYTMWKFINQLLNHISKSTRSLNGFPNETNKYEIEKQCLKESNLNHVFYYEYMKEYISTDTLASAYDIVSFIKDAMIEHIRTLNWMDEDLKTRVKNYILSINVMLGAPHWYNDTAIDLYYKDVNVTSIYLESVLSVLRFQRIRDVKDLVMTMTPVEEERHEWNDVPPLDVEAVFQPDLSTIRVTAAALHFYYNPKLPPVVNFAKLGYTIAHELVHGYDSFLTNTLDDEDDIGMRNSVNIHKTRANCLIEQYRNLKIPGLNNSLNIVNGTVTHSENIADTGVLIAYEAFQAFNSKNNNTQRLVNFQNFTLEQLFFVNFGTLFCETIGPDLTVHPGIIIYDEHAPWSVRLYGTMMNMKEFSDAFNCRLGSPMNPVKKCDVWNKNLIESENRGR